MQLGIFTINIMVIVYIVGIAILFYWSRKLDAPKYVLFLYGWVGSWCYPLFSAGTAEGKFELWFPFGLVFSILYLFINDTYHPLKLKAIFLGLFVGVIKAIEHFYTSL